MAYGFTTTEYLNANQVLYDDKPLSAFLEQLREFADSSKLVPIPVLKTSSSTRTTYNGEVQSARNAFSSFDSRIQIVGGTEEATDAGQYLVRLKLVSSYAWEDGRTGEIDVAWRIWEVQDVPLPIASGTLLPTNLRYREYTGDSLKIDLSTPGFLEFLYPGGVPSDTSNFDVTYTGSTEYVNASTASHRIQIAPAKNHKWINGTSTVYYFDWYIVRKALEVPTANAFTYDGTIRSAETILGIDTSEMAVSSVSSLPVYPGLSNNNIVNAGEYTVTLSVVGTNYCFKVDADTPVTDKQDSYKTSEISIFNINRIVIPNPTLVEGPTYTFDLVENEDGSYNPMPQVPDVAVMRAQLPAHTKMGGYVSNAYSPNTYRASCFAEDNYRFESYTEDYMNNAQALALPQPSKSFYQWVINPRILPIVDITYTRELEPYMNSEGKVVWEGITAVNYLKYLCNSVMIAGSDNTDIRGFDKYLDVSFSEEGSSIESQNVGGTSLALKNKTYLLKALPRYSANGYIKWSDGTQEVKDFAGKVVMTPVDPKIAIQGFTNPFRFTCGKEQMIFYLYSNMPEEFILDDILFKLGTSSVWEASTLSSNGISLSTITKVGVQSYSSSVESDKNYIFVSQTRETTAPKINNFNIGTPGAPEDVPEDADAEETEISEKVRKVPVGEANQGYASEYWIRYQVTLTITNWSYSTSNKAFENFRFGAWWYSSAWGSGSATSPGRFFNNICSNGDGSVWFNGLNWKSKVPYNANYMTPEIFAHCLGSGTVTKYIKVGDMLGVALAHSNYDSIRPVWDTSVKFPDSGGSTISAGANKVCAFLVVDIANISTSSILKFGFYEHLGYRASGTVDAFPKYVIGLPLIHSTSTSIGTALKDTNYNTGATATQGAIMNTTATNIGGWASSYAYKTMMPLYEKALAEGYRKLLCTMLQRYVKVTAGAGTQPTGTLYSVGTTGSVPTSMGGASASGTSAFLPTLYELYGSDTTGGLEYDLEYSNAAVPIMLTYFRNGNRLLCQGKLNGTSSTYLSVWTRSPSKSSSTRFLSTTTGTGAANPSLNSVANEPLAFCPLFTFGIVYNSALDQKTNVDNWLSSFTSNTW